MKKTKIYNVEIITRARQSFWKPEMALYSENIEATSKVEATEKVWEHFKSIDNVMAKCLERVNVKIETVNMTGVDERIGVLFNILN